MKYEVLQPPSYKPERKQLEDFMRKGAEALEISFEEYRELWQIASHQYTKALTQQKPHWRQGKETKKLQAKINTPDPLLWEAIHETIRLEDLAHEDPLTGISNRRSYEIELGRRKNALVKHNELSRRESDPRFYCLFIDIDLFKAVNDTYGHDAGDTVLATIASTMQQSLRADENNFIARIGGEEFCAFVHTSNLQTALSVANRLRENIAKITFPNTKSKTFSVTASIGVSFFDRVDEENTPILEADAALYLAKGKTLENGTFSKYNKETPPKTPRNQIWYCEKNSFKLYSPESITV